MFAPRLFERKIFSPSYERRINRCLRQHVPVRPPPFRHPVERNMGTLIDQAQIARQVSLVPNVFAEMTDVSVGSKASIGRLTFVRRDKVESDGALGRFSQ